MGGTRSGQLSGLPSPAGRTSSHSAACVCETSAVTNTLAWRKSSRCGNSTCVEVARDGDHYLIRDSKNPDTAPLTFTAEEWTAFTTGILAGEFRFD